MLECFDDYLLICSNVLTIACSHAQIFTSLISTHMCTHGDHIGLETKVIALSDVRVLKCFDDYA